MRGLLRITALLLAVTAPAQVPADVTLPLTIFAVDWSDQDLGETPQRAGKAWLERVAADPWRALPWTTYTHLEFVTRDRVATVCAAALGLAERPVLFTAPDGRQPHWGPRMSFSIPYAISAVGKRYRVTVDMAIDNVTRLGGVSLWPVGELTFCEDGSLHLNETEIARYRPAVPLHVEFVVDVPAQTCTTTIDGGEPLTTAWRQPGARFAGLRLDGLLPGGHARAPAKLAFDNIRIILEE